MNRIEPVDASFPNRRKFLKMAACLPAISLFPTNSLASGFWDLPRELWLARKTPNGWEQIKSTYWSDGALNAPGYRSICTLLRDVSSNDAVQMDLVLFDILRGVQGWFLAAGINKPLIINSGYRTHRTNTRTEGSARNSMHLYGKAADFYMEGVSPEYLARLGVYLSGGGVGYYASKGFVHVDSGRLRVWRG
jgi:uncharacterized protein YcbK (DUF882 family)